jgi:hypothetical protein
MDAAGKTKKICVKAGMAVKGDLKCNDHVQIHA